MTTHQPGDGTPAEETGEGTTPQTGAGSPEPGAVTTGSEDDLGTAPGVAADGPTPTAVPVRDRWRNFGAPLLAALAIPTLCLGVLLGWLAFGDRSPGEDSVDAGFARDMSEHHAQATQMSMLVLARSDDEGVQRVAQDIINNQEFERGMMATWLEDWGLPRARTGERMAWMSGHDHAGMELPAGVPMPGMAAPSEIQELTDASGEQAEVLFLQLMTTHHMSGVEMAQAALDAEDPRVRAAAQRMIDTQASEVTLMRDMLADRGAEPREDVDAWLAQVRDGQAEGGEGEGGEGEGGETHGDGDDH